MRIVKKFGIFSSICLSAAVLSAAVEYKKIPTAEKIKDKDLTFAVTFDEGTCNADFARGNPYSTTLRDVGLLLRGTVGFDNNQGFQPGPGEDLMFEVPGNMDHRQGTLTMWVCTRDYNPNHEKTNGVHRKNIFLLHNRFQQGDRFIYWRLYEYGPKIYLEWESSVPPHGWGTTSQISADRAGVGQGDWHQIAIVWTPTTMELYVNGELKSSGTLPLKASKTLDLVADKKNSFIGIKKRWYDDTHKWDVAIDDVKIYSRPLSKAEIFNQYARLVTGRSDLKIQDYTLSFSGCDFGRKNKSAGDLLAAEFDFAVLPEKYAASLAKGTLNVNYELKDESGDIISKGVWNCKEIQCTKYISGITAAGKYTLFTYIDDRSKGISAVIDRPGLDFISSNAGLEDGVPEMWKDFAVNGRSVTLWNRVYRFGEGPYPESVKIKGVEALSQAPALDFDGKKIVWKAGKTIRDNRSVTFCGTGTADGLVIDYKTIVEFDGLINTVFTFRNQAEVSELHLNWQVAPDFREFLLVPTVQKKRKKPYEFFYPNFEGGHLTQGSNVQCKQLWLVTAKKGGFCYSFVNDANWIYDVNKPVFFVDQNAGKCEVRMINKKVTVPAGTEYQSLFIASPVRPLVNERRGLFFRAWKFGAKNYFGTDRIPATTYPFNWEPHEKAYARLTKNQGDRTFCFYGCGNALSDIDPVAKFYGKYWDIPRAHIYTGGVYDPDTGELVNYKFFPACPAAGFTDYVLYNQKKFLTQPTSSVLWCIGYDLCGNNRCANTLHGCGFKDKFGRDIASFETLSKRDLLLRTVAQAHKYGVKVYSHGQRDFNPVLHGSIDYWYPGEDVGNISKRNPYAIMDELPDYRFKSEFNTDVLGVAVNVHTALTQQKAEYFQKPAYAYSYAYMAQLQLFNIEFQARFLAWEPVWNFWKDMQRYNIYDPATECHLFYEQKEVKSSDPDVRITYYRCPDGTVVLFAVNKDLFSHTAEIDMSALNPGSFTAFEEFRNEAVKVVNGKFKMKFPAHSYRMITYPGKDYYPLADGFDPSWWDVWKSSQSDSEFYYDKKTGKTAVPSLNLINKDKPNACFVFNSHPLRPGKEYTLTVWVKSDKDAEATLSIMGKSGHSARDPWGEAAKEENIPGATAGTKGRVAAGKWTQLKLVFKVPAGGVWHKADCFAVTLGGGTANCKYWFDDLLIEEK